MNHFAASAHDRFWHKAAEAEAVSLRQLSGEQRTRAEKQIRADYVEIDPQETLDVHCGNGFDAGLSPYQSTRLSRYNAGP